MRRGRFDVIRILDGTFEAPRDILTHLDGEAAIQQLRNDWPDAVFRIDVNCFALRSESEILLIDAGTGPSWGPALGHAPAALRHAGIALGSVNKIFLTHLHGDHALGLIDRDIARFSTAELLVPRNELTHFTDARARAAADEDALEIFHTAEQLLALYGDRVRPIEPGPVHPLIEAIPLPGHTAAHSGYLLRQDASAILFSGDMIQAVQPILDPRAGLIYDQDPAQAAHTRRNWLERLARTGWCLAGGHLPGFSRVETLTNDRFRLHPAGLDDV